MNQLFSLPSDAIRLVTTRGALVGALLVLALPALAQPLSVTTFAGQSGTRGPADGTGTAARFFGPSGIVADGSGGFYVADALNNTIRRVTSGGVVTTVAGGAINEITNAPDRGYADGTGRAALFSTGYSVTAGPDGPVIVSSFGALTMAIDSSRNLYVADTLNQVIRKITPEGVVTTFAGSPGTAGSVDGTGAAAQFSSPYGVAVDGSGNVFVADAGNNTIRKITPAGVVTTFAGRDGSNAGSADGAGGDARFNNPGGVAADAAGNVYVCDTNNHTIRKITAAGVVSTLAGSATNKGSSDGVGASARFSGPTGITVDSGGNLYIADTGNGTIRKIAAGAAVSTIAGLAGTTGTAEGTGNAVRFAQPYGVAVDTAGNLFIADSGNNTIRKGSAATAPAVTIQTQPRSQFVNVGSPITLSVGATNSSAVTYQWRKNNTPIAGATGSSYTIASAQFSDEANFAVVVTNGATSVTSSPASVRVFPASQPIPPVVFVTQPAEQAVAAGQSVSFVVDVAGAASLTYQWQKNEVNIAGATNSTFTIATTQVADTGLYRVVVTPDGNTANAVNSVSASLSVTAVVTPPPPPAAGRIINLSIQTQLTGPGDNFTMGYVVGGSGTSGAKPLVIRAAGPSLAAFGVGSPLADPKFELYAASTRNGENNDWGGSADLTNAMAAVGAFAFSSPNSKDAAATANIISRDNSVIVSSANDGSGAVLAELYDATPGGSFSTATPRLINVSVRKHLGNGLTAGFVLGGSASTKVLIRAVGPTLASFGVTDVVADPQFTVFNDKQAKIGENDNWGGTAELSAAFTAVGAFNLPGTSKDAVLLMTLPPGLYTVFVNGTAGSTGVALVEVYEVP